MDDETKQAIKDGIAEGLKQADELRAAKGRWLRNWITTKPLPAARVIGTVCLVVGTALGYFGGKFL